MNDDGLMLFDGVCPLCDATVRTLILMDPKGAIRFTPLQSPRGQALAAAHGLDLDDPESFLFLDQGRALRKTAGLAALMHRLPAPWRWLAIVDRLPRGAADAAYDWIARRRYRLGRRDRCEIPSPEHRARFILD